MAWFRGAAISLGRGGADRWGGEERSGRMVTREENELITRVEGDAPMGKLIRENSWIPYALSDTLVAGEPPTPCRLCGENYVSWRAPDGRVGFLAESCPHRQASLLLARIEGDGLRCIYHGWKTDVTGAVGEDTTQVVS